MGLRKTENQVQILLKDTILALCRNTLNSHAEVCVEGLLCITLDSEEVLLVNINKTIENQQKSRKRKKKQAHLGEDEIDSQHSQTKSKQSKSTQNDISTATFSAHGVENATSSKPRKRKKNNHFLDEAAVSKLKVAIPKEEPEDTIVIKEEITPVTSPSGEDLTNYWIHRQTLSPSRDDTTHASMIHKHFKLQDSGRATGDMLPNLSMLNQQMMLSHGMNTEGHTPPYTPVPMQSSSTGQHVCSICGKAFNWQWLLKRHMVVHSGDKDYSCIHCGRTFSYQSSVKRHQDKCAGRLCMPNNGNSVGDVSKHNLLFSSSPNKTCMDIDSKEVNSYHDSVGSLNKDFEQKKPICNKSSAFSENAHKNLESGGYSTKTSSSKRRAKFDSEQHYSNVEDSKSPVDYGNTSSPDLKDQPSDFTCQTLSKYDATEQNDSEPEPNGDSFNTLTSDSYKEYILRLQKQGEDMGQNDPIDISPDSSQEAASSCDQ